MKENGVTVAFYDQEKKKKRMQAYQGYLQKLVEKKQAKVAGNCDALASVK